MKKIFSLIVFSFILIFTFEIDAQVDRKITKVGTTAGQFLKIGAGARALGMGNAYTAVSDDIFASYWNPAGMANSKGFGQVAFNHSEWLADIDYDYAAGGMNLGGLGTAYFTLTSLRVPEEKVRTEDFPEGDGRYWDASALAVGLGYAKSLTDRFSIGFNFKYIQESIWNSKSNGFALDVGTYYITPFNDLVIGASISNFGSKLQLDGRDIQLNIDPDGNPSTGPNNVQGLYETNEYDIPLTFRIGLAMNVIETRYFTLKTAVDASHPNDNTEYVNTGAELAYNDLLFLRGGYKSLFLDDSEQGFTLGGGIRYELSLGNFIEVNYAYADYGRLKDIQYIDVALTF